MSELTDETVNQIDEYIEKCRAMHRSHFGHVPRFAHAISALADERRMRYYEQHDPKAKAAKVAFEEYKQGYIAGWRAAMKQRAKP